MQYKAAIFDLDGTLIDSLADLADSANEMLVGFGFPQHDLDKYRYFVGNGSRKLIERCLPAEKAADSAFVDEALAKYKLCYDKNLTHKTVCYEGIMDMLTALQAKHIPLGICTNKHQSAADVIVDKLFPKDMFVSVIGDCKDMPRKPDPKKVLLIAAKMGVKPVEVAYFGDTSVDMDTGNNAGMLPIGVTWGFRPKEELVEHGAKVLLDNPLDLFSKVEF
ncbi:MAG: HAD family hydrolase [Selenomonas sp.]|nr:HAD family hydrolase [Selenomonas sp.]